MIKDRRAHTTLPALDMERARKWYEEKLGLTPATSTENGMIYTAFGGTRFSLYPTPNPTRGGHTQMGFTSDDIEADVAELKARGVAFEEYDFPGLRTEDSIAQTGDARAAWFKDSEDNIIGIVQLPPGADPAG
jgi:catechol 2,3-dioxygenase-like lactoylglutathione lyase family enzyme